MDTSDNQGITTQLCIHTFDSNTCAMLNVLSLRKQRCHSNVSRGALDIERAMVKLHIKRGDESQFLYETTTDAQLSQLVTHLVKLFNGRLKVDRLCQGSCII